MTEPAIFDQVVAKAWTDSEFKAQLLANPAAALATFGAVVPSGLTIRVAENTKDLDYVVIPLPPQGDQSDDNVVEATGFHLDKTSGEGALYMPFCRWCPFCLDMIARAWRDPAFKAKLLADPRAAVMAMGAEVSEGESITVLENTDHLVHLVLPSPPDGELPENALEMVAAGTAACWIAKGPCWL